MSNSPGRKQINVDFRGHEAEYQYLKSKENLRQYIIGLVNKDMYSSPIATVEVKDDEHSDG